MEYQAGDIVELNFNGCLWADMPSVECEVLETKQNFSGIYRLKLPDGFASMLARRITMETEDAFACHQDWFRLAPVKPIQVDVSKLL